MECTYTFLYNPTQEMASSSLHCILREDTLQIVIEKHAFFPTDNTEVHSHGRLSLHKGLFNTTLEFLGVYFFGEKQSKYLQISL